MSQLVLWCMLLALPAAAQDCAILHERGATLRAILYEHILPFWFPQGIDREYGGYRFNHDSESRYLGDGDKYLVMQARITWFFSRLYRLKLGDQRHLQAARHGYEFLRDKLWDQEFGGFYWAVDYKGKKVTMPDRHLYGQALGLYALSEYAQAAGDVEARHLADRHFALLDERAHDGARAGYIEYFRSDWTHAPPDSTTFFYTTPSTKLMNTHLQRCLHRRIPTRLDTVE